MKMKLMLLAVVLFCGLYGAQQEIAQLPRQQNQSLLGRTSDVDKVLFVEGFKRSGWSTAPSWFAGPWHEAPIKFYRPLTSVAYFAQWQAFGINGEAQFMAVLLALHFAVLALLFLFLSDLLGDKMAALAAGLWGAGLLEFFGLPIPDYALHKWIDQPEMLVSIPFLASLWCLMRYCRSEYSGWLIGSLAAFLVAILVKEMAYTLPFVATALLWQQGKLKSHWRVVAAYFGVAAAMFAFRTWALGGRGYSYGTNGSWFARLLQNTVGGSMMALAVRGDTLPAAVVSALLATLLASRRVAVPALVAMVVAVGLYAVAAVAASGFEDSILLRLLMGELWVKVAMTGVLLWLAYRAIVNRERNQVFGWLWLALTYLPLTTSPITAHALYLPAVGWSIFFAYSIRDVALALAPLYIPKNKKKLPFALAGGAAPGV